MPNLIIKETEISQRAKKTRQRFNKEIVEIKNKRSFSALPEDTTRRLALAQLCYSERSPKRERKLAAAYITAMVEIGQQRGFSVIVLHAKDKKATLEKMLPSCVFNKITVVEIPGKYIENWPEDNGHIGSDNQIAIDRRLKKNTVDEFRLSVYWARARRYYTKRRVAKIKSIISAYEADHSLTSKEKVHVIKHLLPRVNFPVIGKVAKEDLGKTKIALGIALGKCVRENHTILEGGNVLFGTLANGEHYAMVGEDSIAFSRSVLKSHLKEPVSRSKVKGYVARDIGIKAPNIIVVEQPADFHIDMAIIPIAPGRVLVDDPLKSVSLARKWSVKATGTLSKKAKKKLRKRYDKLRKLAKRKEFYFTSIYEKLLAKGLIVDRLPLVFSGAGLPKMNFANGELGVDREGRKVFITNGGAKKAEKFIAKKLKNKYGVEVIFIDRNLSSKSLEMHGGVGCRVKFFGI